MKRYTETFKAAILKDIKEGWTLSALNRAHGIARRTLRRWRDEDADKAMEWDEMLKREKQENWETQERRCEKAALKWAAAYLGLIFALAIIASVCWAIEIKWISYLCGTLLIGLFIGAIATVFL